MGTPESHGNNQEKCLHPKKGQLQYQLMAFFCLFCFVLCFVRNAINPVFFNL